MPAARNGGFRFLDDHDSSTSVSVYDSVLFAGSLRLRQTSIQLLRLLRLPGSLVVAHESFRQEARRAISTAQESLNLGPKKRLFNRARFDIDVVIPRNFLHPVANFVLDQGAAIVACRRIGPDHGPCRVCSDSGSAWRRLLGRRWNPNRTSL